MNLNWGGGYTKSEVDTLLNGKSDTSHTHTKSQITDFPSYGTTANTICEGNDSRLSDARTPTSHTHTKSEITDFPSLATVATSGSYNDLSNKPTIPTVNNATLKIQKNGTDVKTFTANASTDVTCNISVPTKTSDLTNDSGFLTSHQSLSNYSTLANTIKSLSISGKTITYTKGDNTTGTLTTQDNNTWTAMVGATSSSNGSVGYVNAVPPKDGYNTKYLRADGTWQVPPDHTYNVYNKTLTIQKNGTNVATFTSNSNTDVTANISVPTKTSDLTNDSCIPLSGTYNITGTNFFKDVNTSSITISGGHEWNTGAYLGLSGGAKSENPGTFTLHACKTDGIFYRFIGYPNGTLTWGTKNVAMAEDVVPRSGGAVMTGTSLFRIDDTGSLHISGGNSYSTGGSIVMRGAGSAVPDEQGCVIIRCNVTDSNVKFMYWYCDGTWTWDGQPIQYKSDRRLKQQITEIDDKLLDAWEDVELVQFKYNDAVDQKKDKARLHTGYVVQQIDEACKSHNVDISDYGLYCHEEYPEETEEVEVEQADGTKTKETKVIREASEHYSLRYTETLVVECAYLRREVSSLKQQNEDLEQRLKMLEQSVK